MKWIHPQIANLAVVAALAGMVSALGCRNGSGASANPFLAPDRVPPPATRALAPGQAQPYYPGDPLPVMQSAAAPSTPVLAANAPPADSQVTGNAALGWTAPSTTPGGTSTHGASDTRSSGGSNETIVAVPQDGDALRFAPAPTSSALAATAAATTPPSLPATAMAGMAQAVVPASFNSPVIPSGTGVPATPNDYAAAATALPTGPWRSPQIDPNPQTAAGSGAGFPATAGTTTAQPGNIDVRLRAVPSPPFEPLDSTTPRIRLPGYAIPPTQSGATALQPTPFNIATTPAAYNGNLQTFQPAALSPSPIVTPNSVPPAIAPTGSSDGFRPRGSVR